MFQKCISNIGSIGFKEAATIAFKNNEILHRYSFIIFDLNLSRSSHDNNGR